MTLKSKLKFFIFLLHFCNFHGGSDCARDDRIGVSFVEEKPLSNGFSSWKVVSPLKVDIIKKDWQALEKEREKLKSANDQMIDFLQIGPQKFRLVIKIFKIKNSKKGKKDF